MNPWALWIPGSALIVVGALMLAFQLMSLEATVGIMLIGAALESTGVLLWIRERPRKGRP